jgi:hypothetical protein
MIFAGIAARERELNAFAFQAECHIPVNAALKRHVHAANRLAPRTGCLPA